MNSILATDLYTLIYQSADDFTKLRLHQVCHYFYSIKINDTPLMRQIKDCMNKQGSISYTNALYTENCDLLAANLSNCDVNSELAKILSKDDDVYDGSEKINFVLYFLQTHAVSPEFFAQSLIDGRYHAIICDLVNIYNNHDNDNNDARIWYNSLLGYVAKLDIEKILEVALAINYYQFWESLLEYLHVNGLDGIYPDLYQGVKDHQEYREYRECIIVYIIRYNIDSLYPIIYSEYPQLFVNVAIDFTNIPAMRYVAKRGNTVILETDLRDHNSREIALISHYLIDLMDDKSITQLAIACMNKKIIHMDQKYKNKIDYYYLGNRIIQNFGAHDGLMELSTEIYQKYLNTDNFEELMQGIIDSAENITRLPYLDSLRVDLLIKIYRMMNRDQRARIKKMILPNGKLYNIFN